MNLITENQPNFNDKAFTKRVKRRITSKTHNFFVSTSNNLEKNLFLELKQLLPDNESVLSVDGGCEFKGKLNDCYNANLHLRTAGRILMRLHSFKSENFRSLKKKLAEIDWELYLSRDCVPEPHVSLTKSRLYHSGAVSQRVMESISSRMENFWGKEFPSGKNIQKIYIRGINNRFTISLDTTGEHLHKRGLKILPGKAPLRETLAASILLNAGYDGKKPLIDPMCGTGTFSMEASMIATGTPSGLYRNFTFENFPAFSRNSWEHLKKKSSENIHYSGNASIYTSDIDKKTCNTLKNQTPEKFLSMVDISCKNFFDINPATISEEKGLVVINPPYGIRLGSRNESKNLIDKIFIHLKTCFKGWTAVVLSPWEQKNLRGKKEIYKISHGGLDLFVHQYII